jgi:tripartite-type tricarboxylate transporter receptor subunit TctC
MSGCLAVCLSKGNPMKCLISIVGGVLLAATGGTGLAQGYPAKSVKIVVPLGTGSASDAMTRIAAQKLSDVWAQPIVVDNQPGANGITATAAVVKAPPDGYNLMIIAANHVINTSLYSKLPFDAMRDIKPIARMGFTPLLLVVHPSLPVKNVKEFIALAKSQPGKLNYGSAGSGSPTHLTGVLMESMTGMKTVHIPYKSVSNAQADVVGGQIEFLFVVPSFAIPQIQAGRLRGLGVASLKRMPQMPNLPTIDEAGVPGFEVLAWIGIAGPGQIADEIVNKVSTDMLRVLGMPDVRERISSLGLEIAPMPPHEFQEYVVREQAKWAKVVKESGAKAD